MSVSASKKLEQAAVAHRMAELRTRFLGRVAEDRAMIEGAVSRGDYAVVRELAHRLAGTAPSFGLTDIGSAARHVDNVIQAGADESRLFEAARKLIDLLGRCEARKE